MNILQLHRATWQRLQDWRAKLPHALLLAGPKGLGKLELAQAFAAGLLCEQPQEGGKACGACLACRWFEQGNHPDFRILQPEALRAEEGGSTSEKSKRGGQQITIDQVRELDEFFSVGTHRQGLRIILVHPAENMNRSAANAILKVLEEPPASTLFLLISNEPMRLLPTLRSRCQTLPVPVPDHGDALAFLKDFDLEDGESWLALAGGAPLLARRLAQEEGNTWREELLAVLDKGRRLEVMAAAAGLEKSLKAVKGENPLPSLVEWVQKWLVDLNLAGQGLSCRYFLRQRARIDTLARESSPVALSRFYRQLLRLRRESEHPLNVRLFLEQLFFGYRALFVEQ